MDVVLKSNVLYSGSLLPAGERVQIPDKLAADLQKRGLTEESPANPETQTDKANSSKKKLK